MRKQFIIISSVSLLITFLFAFDHSINPFYLSKNWYVIFIVLGILTILGYADMIQKKHAIKRVFPLVGRFRYIFEDLRPKMYQYFIESDINGRPLRRIDRSVVYQRAKNALETVPFGTQLDVYKEGHEYGCLQSLFPTITLGSCSKESKAFGDTE